MRSAIVFLALSLPAMAFGAPTYSSPLREFSHATRHVETERVEVEFFNSLPKTVQLHTPGSDVSVPTGKSVRLRVLPGSAVKVDSAQDSGFAKTLLKASATDHGRTVIIH